MPNTSTTPLYRPTEPPASQRTGIGCEHLDDVDGLVTIMANTRRLGFSLSRVAAALGLSSHQQQALEQVLAARDHDVRADGGGGGSLATTRSRQP